MAGKVFKLQRSRKSDRRLEKLVAGGSLVDQEVFLITDNSSFEEAYYKGHSPTRQLSEIIFRVHKAERDGGFIPHFIHILVLGKQMTASGVDGISCGDLMEGMMSGQDPSRSSHSTWGSRRVVQWSDKHLGTKLVALQEGGRLSGPAAEGGHQGQHVQVAGSQGGTSLDAPPAAMEVTLELLCKDCLAHPQWPHVFVVPRLMTHLWRKDLMKNMNLLFTVPAQVPFWTSRQLEPLIVAIVLPLAHVHSYAGPWLVRGTHKWEQAEQTLQRGFKDKGDTHDVRELHELGRDVWEVWEDPASGSQNVLQQFLAWASNFPPMQECLVRGVLSRNKRRSLPKTGGQQRGAKRHISGD